MESGAKAAAGLRDHAPSSGGHGCIRAGHVGRNFHEAEDRRGARARRRRCGRRRVRAGRHPDRVGEHGVPDERRDHRRRHGRRRRHRDARSPGALRPLVRGRSVPGHRHQYRADRPRRPGRSRRSRPPSATPSRRATSLATADTADLRRELAAAENTLDSARVSLRVANTSLSDAKDADVTAQIRQATIGVLNAKNQLAKAQADGQRPQDPDRGATLSRRSTASSPPSNISAGFDAPSGDGDRRRRDRVPGHHRRGRERPRRRQGRPAGDGLRRRDRCRHRRHCRGDRADADHSSGSAASCRIPSRSPSPTHRPRSAPA